MAYFLEHPFPGNYKHHNWALKNYRHQQKSANLLSDLWLPPEPTELKEVYHPSAGTPYGFEYELHPTDTFKWSWLYFVAQLRDEDIEYMCDGVGGPLNAAPAVRSGGLVSCSLSATPNSYDHKSHFADAKLARSRGRAEELTTKTPEWDFLFTRADGTQVRLHPNHSDTKVKVTNARGHKEPVSVPGALGGSDGPGCYKRITTEGKHCNPLRLVACKGQATAKAKPKAKATFQ